MANILVYMNDVIDAENAGLPADILRQRGHNVLVVLMEGCPAEKKIQNICPKLDVHASSLSDVGGFHYDVVLASMVVTDLIRELTRERSSLVVMVQDRPEWRLDLWNDQPPDVLCVVNDAAAEAGRREWGGELKTLFPRTGMPYFDTLYKDSKDLSWLPMREELGVMDGSVIVHFAFDKFDVGDMAEPIMDVMADNKISSYIRVLPSIHPAASDDDKEIFRQTFEGHKLVLKGGENLSSVERLFVSDMTFASIVSGMLDQASALGRSPIGVAREPDMRKLKEYAAKLTNSKDHPLVKTGMIVPVVTAIDMVKAIELEIRGNLKLEHFPAPDGRCAERVALVTEMYV